MRFKKTPFPPGFVTQRNVEGSRLIAAFSGIDGNMFVTALVTDDPSRMDGTYERHISVSVLQGTARHPPSREQAMAACRAAGLGAPLSVVKTREAWHGYFDIPKEDA